MTATTTVAPALAEQIRALLEQANLVTVPRGVLAWWGNTELPDGTTRVPTLTQQAFEGMHFLVENAALDPGTVKPLAFVQAGTRDMRADGPLPIAIASYRAEVPRAELAHRVRSAAADGRALRFPPRSLGDAIEPRRVFAASGLLHDQWGRATPVYRGRHVTFMLDRSFHLTDPDGALPDAIEVDLGDGRGFQSVDFGTTFGAEYPEGDAATVAIRCRYGDEVLTARFQVAIADVPAPPAPDDTWRLQAPAAAADGRPGNSGRAYVFRAPGHSDVVNPVIVVEGFPGGHACDYMYELLNQAGTLESLRGAGYDVVIVGLDQGGDLIQRNAPVLQECIGEARRRTAAPLVVGGVSMGGIISRLALAEMEARGEEHGTRIYVSIDTPHRGAYTSLGVQWFVQSLREFAPALATFGQLLDAPSNQQIMIAWLHDGTTQVSPLREQLLADLAAVGGYPQRPRRIAVSCGRGDGARSTPPGARTLAWNGEPFASAVLNALPDEAGGTIAEGSWFLNEPPALPPLASDGTIAWDAAPGGQATYNGQVAAIAAGLGCGSVDHDLDTTCSVPAVSALDLDQDPFAPIAAADPAHGPFHDHVCSAANELHLTITPEVSGWLLNQLGEPPGPAGDRPKEDPPMTVTPIAKTWDPATFNPHDPEYLGNPYPTYARFREHAPVADVAIYGSKWVFRYSDVQRVLTETETFAKSAPKGAPPPKVPPAGPARVMAFLGSGLFSSDPPRHTLLREAIEPLFGQAIGQAPQLAAQFADPIVAEAMQTGRIELVADYALPVPSSVLFSILGLPADPLTTRFLLTWVTAIVMAHDVTQSDKVKGDGATCAMALNAFLGGYVAMARREPQPGLLGAMCAAVGDDAAGTDGLTATDVQVCGSDFIVAGYLSTTYLIASGIRTLLAHPEQLEALRADPSLIDYAVWEMLRFDAPAQLADRVVAVETELGGVPLEPGDRVTAVLGSADHDPEAFDSPDEFRIDRDSKRHLSFGAGIHHCIGAPLVGLVAPVAFKTLLELPDLAVDGLPQWQTDPYLRGMVNLPMRTA